MDINVDVLIAGSGVSGLYCALNLREDLKILVVTKGKIDDTNTYLAQGGISTARNKKDIALFIEDTLKAGQYKNDVKSVKILAEESIDNIGSLIDYGIDLDKDDRGLLYTREGAHSVNRIVHCKDHTGKEVEETLIKESRKSKNITIYEETYLADILKYGNMCIGAVLIKDDKQLNIHSKVVVLATGGVGGIFNNSTNQRQLTGDGISIAIRNKIKLKSLDYIQFHPTALYDKTSDGKRFLISEAVRGEGGRLYNSKGERFVDELLPRDVVSEAIRMELNKSGKPFVNLDISFLDKKYIIGRFPSIYRECLKRGIDITKEPIPVSPAQHFLMGGIETDYNSKTSMEALYAVGETSCTGVHGANRLASNSLLEGLVFSKRAAEAINKTIDKSEIIPCFVSNYVSNVEDFKKENKRLVIEEFKRRSNKLDDGLFNY